MIVGAGQSGQMILRDIRSRVEEIVNTYHPG